MQIVQLSVTVFSGYAEFCFCKLKIKSKFAEIPMKN
jgi:hypothetical protein